LRKAILEAAQSRLGFISGARDDLEWSDYWTASSHVRTSRLRLLKERATGRDFARLDAIGPHDLSSLSPFLQNELSSAVMFHWQGFGPAHLNIVKVIVPQRHDGLDPEFEAVQHKSNIVGHSSLHVR